MCSTLSCRKCHERAPDTRRRFAGGKAGCMDGSRFDTLVRSRAEGASRRTLLKGVLGIGAAAIASRQSPADAARRPAPTPKPITCPGAQQWDGASCVCSSGTTCGPDCCETEAQCCDSACCPSGQVCSGEETCCAPSCDFGVCGSDGCGGLCGCDDGLCVDGICFNTLPKGELCYDHGGCGQFFYEDFDLCVGQTDGESCTSGACAEGFGCIPEPWNLCYLPCW